MAQLSEYRGYQFSKIVLQRGGAGAAINRTLGGWGGSVTLTTGHLDGHRHEIDGNLETQADADRALDAKAQSVIDEHIVFLADRTKSP